MVSIIQRGTVDSRTARDMLVTMMAPGVNMDKNTVRPQNTNLYMNVSKPGTV